jgi:DNA-binding NtrC family response regulator
MSDGAPFRPHDEYDDLTMRVPVGLSGDARPPAPPKVLVIEDDEAVRTVLGRVLAAAGFEPVLAAGSADAERLLSSEIAAMVLDFRIPGSRGDLFFYYASSRFPLLRRRTVFLTGDTSIEVEQMVAHTGCTMRHKPFVNSSLVQLMWTLVDVPTGAARRP